ncbi:MAG: peptide deformylase [Candidatus Falkowbacteria bacterium]
MPQLLNIITDPNPILRKKSRKLDPKKLKTRQIQELCEDMVLTMLEKDGVGLAAPQIGKNIRIITVNMKDGAICMINPEITKRSWLKEWGAEGCLSIPGVFGQVRRHKKVDYSYIDGNGKVIKTSASGLLARVLQHEIDHLDGILFTDKARDITPN